MLDIEKNIDDMKDILSSFVGHIDSEIITDDMLKDDIMGMAIAVKNANDAAMYNVGLKRIWSHIAMVNKYFQQQEPWKVVKVDPEFAQYIFYVTARSLESISILIYPVMPQTTEKILKSLGLAMITPTESINYTKDIIDGNFRSSYNLSPSDPLFMKIKKDHI